MSVKLVVLALIFVVSCAYANPAARSNYIEQENSCRQVCGLCDCDGFYCEDECICECNMEDDENLQCIADMKKECDANGLEYELLMQESAKERFLRQVKEKASPDFTKHLMILKQKRGTDTAAPAETPSEPIVGAAAPSSDPIVAAPGPTSAAAPEEVVGVPLDPFSQLKVKKVLVDFRESISKLRNAVTPAPAPITWPTIGTPQGKIFIVPTPAPIALPTTAAPSWLNPASWKAALPDTSKWTAALPDTSSWRASLPVQPSWLQ